MAIEHVFYINFISLSATKFQTNHGLGFLKESKSTHM